jgi:uncharacterized protein (DUF1330 family)
VSIIRKPGVSKVKAYLVLDLAIHDFAQGVPPTPLEGDWRPERMVVIEFPTRENAEAFLSDPDCQALFRIRHQTTTSKLVLVDGNS